MTVEVSDKVEQLATELASYERAKTAAEATAKTAEARGKGLIRSRACGGKVRPEDVKAATLEQASAEAEIHALDDLLRSGMESLKTAAEQDVAERRRALEAAKASELVAIEGELGQVAHLFGTVAAKLHRLAPLAKAPAVHRASPPFEILDEGLGGVLEALRGPLYRHEAEALAGVKAELGKDSWEQVGAAGRERLARFNGALPTAAEVASTALAAARKG